MEGMVARAKKQSSKKKTEKESFLVKLSTFFIKRWQAGLAVWLSLLLGGAFVYTSVITREGFPPISFPISIVSGTYLVDDVERVDSEVTAPISAALGEVADVTDIEASAGSNFFAVTVSFDETLNSQQGTDLVRSTIEESVSLPEQATLAYSAIDPGSFLFEYDLLVQVYSTGTDSPLAIDMAAENVAEQLTALDIVERADAQNNVSIAIDPTTGQEGQLQSNFSRVGVPVAVDHTEPGVAFYNATTIGVDRVEGEDTIDLSNAVEEAIANLDRTNLDSSIDVVIGADFAGSIETQIEFLESNMLTGLLAVALVSFLLITWRASIITALFMLTVMVTTIMVLFLIGYTLNTITLFALILSLGLFVDDATIVVEALDVSKRNKKASAIKVVADAIRRVGRASLSGTLTTVLVFAILATPTGILGQFIRLIPITVIVALLLSFFLSITLIPLLSKFIILKNREPSAITKMNPVIKIEEWLAEAIEKKVLAVRTLKGKLFGAGAILLSLLLIMTGFYIFGFKVDNNTFPNAKDSDQLGVSINYAPGTSVEDATAIAAQVDAIVGDTLAENFVQGNYGIDIQADDRQAGLVVDLIPFTDRDVTSPELVAQLQTALHEQLPPVPANVVASQIDNGPPSEEFPFGIRVFSEDVDVLRAATQDIAQQLEGQVIENFNGTTVEVLDSRIDGLEGEITREDGKRYAITRFAYDSDNSTVVSLLTEERFLELYDEAALNALGVVSIDDIGFDAGQEGDFQDSFATLALAVPISLLLMYLLLVVQFRSLLQPGLILLAIPFTLFGVAAGLWGTDNAASFFALTGFIGLIGIAVNNTIMLTDYANQERRDGKGPIEAIAAASRKRFRPLLATSITTVVALLPLALTDPFWEALAFTIIFGLLSSTFLVIISFPYYYLALEWLRRGTRRVFKRA